MIEYISVRLKEGETQSLYDVRSKLTVPYLPNTDYKTNTEVS